MYIPKYFACDNLEQICDFISRFGFATLVSSDLQFSQLPLYLRREKDGRFTLYGHMASANPHWELLADQQVLAIFKGPHSYISPTYYSVQPSVPTWNYLTVEARGTLSLLDQNETVEVLRETVLQYEPALWGDEAIMPAAFVEKLAAHIVGLKIVIEASALLGKFKLNQNKPLDEQFRVLAALQEEDNLEAQALAAYWRTLLPAGQ